MAYTSFFSGGGSTTKAQPNNSGNGTGAGGKGGYKSFFGTRVQSAPTDDQLKIDRAQKAQQDAITRQQQQKQQQAQAQQQKNNSFFNKAKNFVVNDVAKPIVNTVDKSANTVAAGGVSLAGGAKVVGDLATGNKQAAVSTAGKTNKSVANLLSHGAGNAGGYLTPQQAASSGGGKKGLVQNFVKPTIKATADVAPLVLPVGGEVAGGTRAAKIAYGAATNAGVGAASTAASELADGKVHAKDVLKGAAYGGILGAGGELVTAGGDKAVAAANHLGMHPRVTSVLEKSHLNQVAAATGKDKGVNDLLANSRTQSLLSTPKPKESVAAASTAPVASITHPVTEAFDKVYKGGAQGADEAKAAHYIRDNPEKALTDYDSRVKDKFGATNVVSGDESKYVIPGFDSTKSASYHEPASALAKVKYQQLLSDTTTKNKPVLLMAGGSGAGKTSALKRLGLNYDNYAAVIDTNTNKLASAQGRIDQALQSGRHVEVFYVHRDPLKAMSHGVIPRGGKEGRIVPIDTHIDTHFGAHDTVHQLADHYKDNPQVEFTVASNNHGHGKARQIELDQVPKMSYNREEIKQHLQKAVNDAHQEGKITPQEHALYHGQSNPVGEAGHDVQAVDTAGSRAPSNQPKPQRTTGSERGADQKVAVASAPDTATIKEQITNIKNNEQNYDKFGNLTPEAGKQINGLNKQLNAAGERVAKVDKPVTVTPIEPPARVATPEIKTSKLARGVEANAIRKGLTDGFEGKAEYAGVNISQQAKAAADLLKQDPEQALKIAMGEAHPPEGLLPESVFIALEKQATKAGDTDLIRRLATESRLTSEASGMGQRIRMLGERDGNSAVTAIKQVQKARKAAAEQRANKPLSKAVSNEIKQIRAAKPKVTKETWSSFVDSLKC